MKENFSKRIQAIIKISKQEAIRLGHSYVGSEHLLLGLIKCGTGLSQKIFEIYDLDSKKIISSIEDLIKTSGGSMTLGHLPLTRRAERILRNSFKESMKLDASYADDEHLLLAILSESDGIAIEILRSLSFDYDTVKDLVCTNNSNLIDRDDSEAQVDQRLGSSKTPTLNHFSRDLTLLATKGKLDPVLGREIEIERLVQILSRRKKNNPVLIGEPGVGKTSIIEGLAQRIIHKTLPRVLHNQRILSLDIASIVAGTKYRGQFEERLKSLMREIENSKNIIIFIDELHTIVGAGGAGGSLDASNMFKPSLARGDINCIGATTLDEYKKVIEKDGALDRRFQKIIINPPTLKESIDILDGLKSKYEEYHFVKYTKEAIVACVYLSDRYISDMFLPDKAIDVLDESGARAHMYNHKVPKGIIAIENKLTNIREQKEIKVNNQQFEEAAILRDNEKKILTKLKKAQKKWNEDEKRVITEITADDVADVVSSITGIPLSKISESENNNLINLEADLGKYIIGQGKAIFTLSKAIRRSRVGLSNPNKPNGVFLFLGPTGVGKTELAKSLAKHLFPHKHSLVKIDMSEYKEQFSLSRLIGAPPGYVGYEEGGELTEKVRKSPHSLILLDEIEKGHESIYNILLQVFDEGILTDGLGRKIDFKNTIIIMTSNIGTRYLENNEYGFGDDIDLNKKNKIRQTIKKEVMEIFSPELLNRIDESIIFDSLNQEDVFKIIDIQLQDLVLNLEKHGIKIKIYKSAKKFLATKGYNTKYGVRSLKRKIQQYLEDPISDMFLKKIINSGTTISVKYQKNKIQIDTVLPKINENVKTSN